MAKTKKSDDDFIMPMTYSGLLDDVLLRYPLSDDINDTFFSRSILKNIFFGDRIYLNDGYVLNHPPALDQILSKKDTLLRMMVRHDFIRILSRQQDAKSFSELPEQMAERGVDSFRLLTSRSDWLDIKTSLRNWSTGLYHFKKISSWPKYQMHSGFRKLFKRILDKEPKDVGFDCIEGFSMDDFRRRYENHAAHENAPRTAIEDVANAMATEGRFAKKYVAVIMNVANQCYHYNFAMCLSKSTKEPVVADTTIGLAFEDILELDDAVEAEIGKIPILSIPVGFPLDKGAIFDRIVDPQSDLFFAKYQFLKEMHNIMRKGANDPNYADRIKSLNDAANEYRKLLAENFSEFVKWSDLAPRRAALITYGVGTLTKAGIGAVAGVSAVPGAAVLAANLIAPKRVSSFVNRATRTINRKALEVGLNPSAGDETKAFVFTASDMRPRFASLAFNKSAVSDHVSDLPKM